MSDVGNLPLAMFCFIAVFGTIFLSDSLLSRIRFRLLLIRFFFTCLVISRVSPVPGHTFHTYRSPYTGGFSLVLFQFLPNFHGLRPIEQGSTSSFLLLLREVLFTIRQDSLYVAVCMIVSTSYEATLSIRLVPCITTTHRIWLYGSLVITIIGLTPIGVPQLCWARSYKVKKLWCIPPELTWTMNFSYIIISTSAPLLFFNSTFPPCCVTIEFVIYNPIP